MCQRILELYSQLSVKPSTNVSCQLKFRPFVSCQLKFRPFVSCQLTPSRPSEMNGDTTSRIIKVEIKQVTSMESKIRPTTFGTKVTKQCLPQKVVFIGFSSAFPHAPSPLPEKKKLHKKTAQIKNKNVCMVMQ